MTDPAKSFEIDTRSMRYTADALKAIKSDAVQPVMSIPVSTINTIPDGANGAPLHEQTSIVDSIKAAFGFLAITGKQPLNEFAGCNDRVWSSMKRQHAPAEDLRKLGKYPRTTDLAPWVKEAFSRYYPDAQTRALIEPFCKNFHEVMNKERQITLEVAAAILLASDRTENPIEIMDDVHSSKAGGDSHFHPWGTLLTGLDCQPNIIAIFAFYLMMCQSFTFEKVAKVEDYIYSTLTGIDFAKGAGKYSSQMGSFEQMVKDKFPHLHENDLNDRSFWRVALSFLANLNQCENIRPFKHPKTAHIAHDLAPDLIIAMRAFDTIGSCYMSDNGSAFLDDAGIDSLIGTALPNDTMDLHTDIKTGETRNLIRLLYPADLTIDEALHTMSILYGSILSAVFRGHRAARLDNREDGRIVSTSPPYSFCRARHRKIFEVIELYMDKYGEEQFWEWTMKLFEMGKTQVTDAGLNEALRDGLLRAVKRESLADSPPTKFFTEYWPLIESGAMLSEKNPLLVTDELSETIHAMHQLYHIELRQPNKEKGWGKRFDARSDELFGETAKILLDMQAKEDAEHKEEGVYGKSVRKSKTQDAMYKFSIAFGRLAMGLPYVCYHTVDAIIMAYGVETGSAA